jgi:hypothetical protein
MKFTAMLLLPLFALPAAAQTTAPTTRPAARTDAHGNPLRVATKTGHVSNYDEDKVGSYTLPNPLILNNGQPVTDATTWFTQRRPEIIKLYEEEIYGRVPDNAPALAFSLVSTDDNAMNGKAIA